ncbi:peptidoglycan recognition family protein [Bacillus sp. FJAT-49736]|uniref:peptidoglycan recognition protein family protein n=1 Tax=Bacillus sp. FJAT-49736 TaxID=2833582 RepID=UPI001BC91607|nr:peptidoglycan recognition family protein [Bacillus sp. FJAT-49736]MBS4173876.1 N-acetylmuramoyl-L-alanine amidase [Bacillus sp. FJAT-49736]
MTKERLLVCSFLFIMGMNFLTPAKAANQTENTSFKIMTRDEFKNWLFNQTFSRQVGKIQLHHTWKPSYEQFDGSNHLRMLKGMENYHKSRMKWSHISQHLTIFPDGRVALGRPFNLPPEGTFGLNNKAVMRAIEADSIAIENIGDFDKGHDQMTREQKETIVTVTALLCIKYGLTPTVDSITYHHWWDIKTGERVLDNGKGHAVKTCPGTGFFGGNSTTSAKNNLYPLISKKMKEIAAKEWK